MICVNALRFINVFHRYEWNFDEVQCLCDVLRMCGGKETQFA